MTTFKQFLTDGVIKFNDDPDSSLIEMLQAKSRKFLGESSAEGLLYRGMAELPPAQYETADGIEYWVKSVRTDRKPLGTGEVLQRLIDNWFFESVGFRARATSMFCYPEESVRLTKQYGKTYIVVPISGDMDYVWSPKVGDLYGEIVREDLDDDATQREVNEMLDNLHYKDHDLHLAVKAENEIMIRCNSYFVFKYEDNDKIKQALEKIK